MILPKLLPTICLALLAAHASAGIDSQEARRLSLALGLTPETVTVLGFNDTQTEAAFDRLYDNEQLVAGFLQQEQQLQAGLEQRKDLERTIRFAENQSEIQQMQAHIDSLDQQIQLLRDSIEVARAQLRSLFLGSVDASTVLRVCQPEAFVGLVPPEYRVVDLDEDYPELYAALLAERRALDNNEQVDTNTQLVLSHYRNLPAVLQARTNLLYNLDGVRAAFNK